MSTSETEHADPDILRSESAPGEWKHRTVGGTIITWALPPEFTIDEFSNKKEEWVVELVLKQHGEYGDEYRPVDVLVIDYPWGHIVDNYLDEANAIATECDDFDQAAKVAVEFMKENPGMKQDQG